MRDRPRYTRRQVARAAALLGLSGSALAADTMRTREIPVSGEALPVIGLGTYSVFDIDPAGPELESRRTILATLGSAGGSVVDTSPMYKRSEAVIGKILQTGSDRDAYFLATKVWINGSENGEQQMRRSAELMGIDRIDLMQVHNRRDLDKHWPTIRAMKESGFVRYDGVTDYRASAHGSLAEIIDRYEPDFIQVNYSLGERDAEERLLPLAKDSGVAVLVNRPFVAGRLFRAVGRQRLPGWATEFAESWGQFFLKYIVSHPAVTCVIPATTSPQHMLDNAGAGTGPLPDEATRKRMAGFFDAL